MYWDVHEDFERLSNAAIVARSRLELVWRASPHCGVVNLVRSGRKQPQLFPQVPGARLASFFTTAALADTALKNGSTSSFTQRKLRCLAIFCLVSATLARCDRITE